MHHLRRHSRSTNERTKHILALNDGPATSNHFTSMWTVQHRVESTTKVKLRIVRCMYAFVRVKRMRVCVRAAAAWDWAQHSFVHLLLTRQRWCDAMIENIHSVVTHSKTLYRLFRSGHFACDICYLWFCTRGDVLLLAIWDAVDSSMHWMHLDETAPKCILHVYAPVCETPLSTLMKYIFQIYIPTALIRAGRELEAIGVLRQRWSVWITNKYHKSSYRMSCKIKLVLHLFCACMTRISSMFGVHLIKDCN